MAREMFGYDAVQRVVEQISTNAAPQIEAFLTVSKSLAVAFILMNWLKDLISSMNDLGSQGRKAMPIPFKSIFMGIIYITVVCNTNAVFGALDSLLSQYVGTFNANTGNNTTVESIFNKWCTEFETLDQLAKQQEESNIPVLGGIYNLLHDISDLIGGAFYFVVLVIIKGIAWVVHTISYPVFLIERGFLLFIMKLTAPLVFAVAALEQYRDLFWKWIKVYMAIFITGLFFIVVTWFCDAAFLGLAENFASDSMQGISPGEIAGLDLGYKDRHMAQVCFYTMIAIAKVKLYQSSISLSNRIFA